MKKAITLILLAVILISAVSCKSNDSFNFEVKDGEVGYHELGLYFKLPENFKKKNAYSEIEMFYTDGDASFFYNVYSGEAIKEKLGLDPDITVEDYTKKFIIFNALEMDYEYDEERDRTTFGYVYTYPDGETDPERYIYIVMRGSAHLYVITMGCDEESYPKYKDMFDELIEIIYAE